MPLLDDQEITMHRPAEISYWEGLVSISGTLAGRGYLEMTGYAKALELS
jgi:predicted secreted hydrolase